MYSFSKLCFCGGLEESLWMCGDGRKGRREVIRDEEKYKL
jgi:hypothetical protein